MVAAVVLNHTSKKTDRVFRAAPRPPPADTRGFLGMLSTKTGIFLQIPDES